MGNKKHNKKQDYSKREEEKAFIVLKNDNHDGTGNRT